MSSGSPGHFSLFGAAAGADNPVNGPECESDHAKAQAPHHRGKSCPCLDLVGFLGAEDLVVIENEKAGERQSPGDQEADQTPADDSPDSVHGSPPFTSPSSVASRPQS